MANIAISEIETTAETLENQDLILVSKKNSDGTFTSAKMTSEKLKSSIKSSIPVATTSVDGLMSAADKSKLDGIQNGAEVNQNAFSNVKVGSTTISSSGKTDTFQLEAGANVTLTPDTTNKKIVVSATGGESGCSFSSAAVQSACSTAISSYGTAKTSDLANLAKSSDLSSLATSTNVSDSTSTTTTNITNAKTAITAAISSLNNVSNTDITNACEIAITNKSVSTLTESQVKNIILSNNGSISCDISYDRTIYDYSDVSFKTTGSTIGYTLENPFSSRFRIINVSKETTITIYVNGVAKFATFTKSNIPSGRIEPMNLPDGDIKLYSSIVGVSMTIATLKTN